MDDRQSPSQRRPSGQHRAFRYRNNGPQPVLPDHEPGRHGQPGPIDADHLSGDRHRPRSQPQIFRRIDPALAGLIEPGQQMSAILDGKPE